MLTGRMVPYFAARIRQNHQLVSAASVLNESASSDDAIQMTPNCIRRMKELQASEGEMTLRLSVEGGRCQGFRHVFNLDEKGGQNDRVFESGGVKLVVDNASYDFVKGATIDYSEEFIRSAFEVSNNNPRAVRRRGCDISFTV